MKSSFARLGAAALALGLTGLALDAWFQPTWQVVRRSQPALELRELETGLGQGLTIGLLGGFRAVIADLLWLKTNSDWEQRDLPATQTLVRLVTTIDPRPLYFWINGARMLAYDMPPWRIEAAGGYQVVPAAVQRRFEEEQAAVALRYLERALAQHAHDPLLYVEMANIHLRKLGDVATAAEYYKLAAGQPGAPFFAARIHAELLKRLGRTREAYEYLTALHRRLPPDNPMAMSDLVLERIRELEEQLAVPSAGRYRPPPPSGATGP